MSETVNVGRRVVVDWNLAADIKAMDGLFVGMLDVEQLARFEEGISEGIARRIYEGVGGFMGLAKVKCLISDPKS